jgi:hypothetical protein
MGKKKWKRFLALVNGVLGQSAERATREVLRAQTEATRAEAEATRADRAEMSMLEWRKLAQRAEFALWRIETRLLVWRNRGLAGQVMVAPDSVAVRQEEIEEALRMVEEGRGSTSSGEGPR